MPASWEKRHKRWIELRAEFQAHKREKEWASVVKACEKIVKYAEKNPDLSIVTWLFMKHRANALEKQDLLEKAIQGFEDAIRGCEHYRATESLREPDDFLKDIGIMQRKIEQLKKKR